MALDKYIENADSATAHRAEISEEQWPDSKSKPEHKRSAGAFQSPSSRRKYWIIMAILVILALGFTWGLIKYNNPMPVGHPGFQLIAERRMTSVFIMVIVAVCQALATVAFQTVTNNRIITPSIMGFESLYTAIHTATIFLFGATALIATRNLSMFVFQMALMIAFTLILYTWLLAGRNSNMHAMLLVGIIIGGGLGSVSTFMQRMLTPSEFDILSARLFGSVNNAETEYLPIAVPLVVVAGLLLLLASRRLNVLSLGRDTSTNLGMNHRVMAIYVLILVSILMAVSTSLVGPMVFLGFLVATLSYQFADTYDHRYIFPMSILLGFVVLTGAYFVMNHIFNAQGVVSIIIELVGGSLFLFVILRKGRL